VRIIRAFAAVAAGLTVAAAGISVMSAAALADQHGAIWVSGAPTVAGGGTSCTQPGYNTIQAAISAAPSGATIRVCAGTYAEQLQITSPVAIEGVGTVVIELPATPANSSTACDTAPGTGPFQPDQDGVAICGAGTVRLIHLTIDAA
jgi:pectin methylesterase-like acyl-CoA thioesterase